MGKVKCPACGKIQTISRNTAKCRHHKLILGHCEQRLHHRKDKYEDPDHDRQTTGHLRDPYEQG
jgi:hypothetical protein